MFIDADHSYKAAKQDFEMYSPLVKKGGIVGFHDLKPAHIINAEFGVHILFEELKKKYEKYKEIIEDPKNQQGFGIGLVWI